MRLNSSMTVAANPGETSLDHPAPRMHGEADLVDGLTDDLNCDEGGFRYALSGVGGVGEGMLDKRAASARCLQQRYGAISFREQTVRVWIFPASSGESSVPQCTRGER